MTKEKKRLIKKLRDKYRLVLINDTTFEERFSFRLSPMNVFIAFSVTIVLFTTVITSTIFYTPLKEYIPGYADEATKQTAIEMTFVVDSLEKEIRKRDELYDNTFRIMNNEVPDDADGSNPSNIDSLKSNSPQSNRYLRDSAFKAEMESNDNYNLSLQDGSQQDVSIANFSFMPPVKGMVTDSFNIGTGHYAIDVVTKPNATVKSSLDGTVVLASWTPETGHVICVQHRNNLLSIYKHNAVLLKKVGTFVKGGDAIAIVGNSGELTTGPHLHFELWSDGSPLNPGDLLAF